MQTKQSILLIANLLSLIVTTALPNQGGKLTESLALERRTDSNSNTLKCGHRGCASKAKGTEEELATNALPSVHPRPMGRDKAPLAASNPKTNTNLAAKSFKVIQRRNFESNLNNEPSKPFQPVVIGRRNVEEIAHHQHPNGVHSKPGRLSPN